MIHTEIGRHPYTSLGKNVYNDSIDSQHTKKNVMTMNYLVLWVISSVSFFYNLGNANGKCHL